MCDTDDHRPLAADDAVTAPALGDRGALLMIAGIDQEMPVRVLLGIMRDASNDTRTPACFRFDEHRDVLHLKRDAVVGFVVHRFMWNRNADEMARSLHIPGPGDL